MKVTTRKTYEWWDKHLDKDGRQSVADGFKARCPSHADEGPSLHVTRKGAAGAVVHCFAGCEYQAIVDAARDGRTEDATTSTPDPVPRETGDKRDPIEWLAEYTGVPVESLRSLPLEAREDRVAFTFPHNGVVKLRRAGTKEFAWSPKGNAPPMWPEPAERMEETIYLTEGETDCIILRHLGLPAYAITKGGNSTLSDAVFRELHVRGVERIVLAFDADDTGEEAAEAYSDAIVASGMTAARVQIPLNPFFGEKDLRDWYRRTGGEDPLEVALDQKVLLTYDELVEITPSEVPWISWGYVARQAVTLLAGPPKAGKTTLLYELMRCLESGAEFLNAPGVTHRGEVAMMTEEYGPTLIEKATRFDVSPRILTQGEAAMRGWTFSEALSAVAEECVREKIPVLVIDTLSAWAQFKDENDAAEVTKAMTAIRTIALSKNLAVIVVHHTKKGGGEYGEESRGSSAMFAMADIYMRFAYAGKNRKVEVRSRFANPPAEVTIEMDEHTNRLTTITRDEQQERDGEPVLQALTGGRMGRADIVAATGISDTDLRGRVLPRLLEQNKIREHTGKHGRKEYELVVDALPGGAATRMKVPAKSKMRNLT